MPGMLYQIINRERQLIEIARRKRESEAKPKPKLTLKVTSFVTKKPGVEEVETLPDVISETQTQTVGLHNVPTGLVNELKSEAKRRSVKGKRVTLTDVALECFQIGLTELRKQDIKQ